MSASPVLAFQEYFVVLIASPDPQLRVRAGQCFNSGQWKAESVSSGAEAIVRLESRAPSPIVLLIDRGLPDLEPVELSNFVLSHFPEMHVCIVDSSFAGFTPHAIPGLAPSHLLDEVLGRLQPDRPDPGSGRAMPISAGPASLPGIVSQSPQFADVARLVRLVSRHKTSVLLQGETGTGKELVARALHELSPRHHHPFVAVNCAAIPEALMESELFGHLRGAFTGALQSRVGRVQAADRGTLFLDEIGELPLPLQAKLLRFLQDGEVYRLGSTTPEYPDVRVVAATNSALNARSQAGTFRSDLLFRLNAFPINLPALRQRTADIPVLASYFLDELCAAAAQPPKRFSSAAMQALQTHAWPGNVRELRHAVERAFILADGHGVIEPEHFLPFFTLES